MKPAFALSFSSTGISLHHFADGDWFCVGEVALDAPDLNAQIIALREKGFALENDLNCKLVIPADQVRFLSVPTEGLNAADSAEQARTELADATPYDLEELAFVTETDGTTTYVAAVARQTLEEARVFAAEHGFVPVQYTTTPEDQAYPSEPVFLLDTPSEPPAKENTAEQDTGPAVHAIADTESPTEFRSAPTSDKAGAATGATALKRYAIPAAAAAALACVGMLTWSMSGSDTPIAPETAVLAEPEPEVAPDTQVASTPAIEDVGDAEVAAAPEPEEPMETLAVEAPETEEAPEIAALAPAETEQPQPEESPDISATDAAILEALNIAPTSVEPIERAPEVADVPTQAGIEITVPGPLPYPILPQTDDLYLASLDRTDLSQDAVALPPVTSFETDLPFEQIAQPAEAGVQFELDERGLVTPTAEGTLNPEGVVVYLGRPSKVPPAVPVRFEQEPIEEDPADRLAQYRPKPRPANLLESFERSQLGGRTRAELAVVRPKLRPESLQSSPEVDETPTALAVVRVPRPKPRPAGLKRPTPTNTANLGSTAAVNQSSDEAGSFQARSVAPKIPSTASVARQATIDRALNLRKLNLIGVYGTPANRRALVRLPSGRYKKLKVGDRLDGGSVIAIGDSELRYQKRGKNVILKMPRG
ncbi:hypothetical protein [Ruegeria sp. R14_0]|uniref:hypothetical protein n=1 Tax=Ruegeria sp. R14_0 TaxID=2821100 RepID=UPI001ADCE80E|nr:hypothetical protein [Ruegeria sp. R14_0]MBO9446151.1 hypothetical protein [Ruegeria sp. R14_0]